MNAFLSALKLKFNVLKSCMNKINCNLKSAELKCESNSCSKFNDVKSVTKVTENNYSKISGSGVGLNLASANSCEKMQAVEIMQRF